ncbi:MAG: NAD-dependent epimerase/dehydratase family protein [Magnetococcales bacterium]|nr:NAD-dependent epimerase/dehydratase family protein [Magnetococcales bacterium]
MAIKRVVVTGARGFLGSQTLPSLLDRGYEVFALSREVVSADHGVTWVQGDILDPRSMQRVLENIRPSHLLHCAWITTPGHFWSAAENWDWVAASLFLARNFAACGGKRLVAVGTCVEYDIFDAALLRGEPCREDVTPLVPHTAYGQAKHGLGRMLHHLSAHLHLSMAWGRVFQPYGEGEPEGKLLSHVAGALARNEPVLVTSGQQKRDFIEARDAGRALAILLDSDLQGDVNIGTGKGTSVAEAARLLGHLAGKPSLIRLGALPVRAGDPPCLVADTQRMQTIGFVPLRTLEEGLRHLLSVQGLTISEAS